MEHFSKAEIAWIISEMEAQSERLKIVAKLENDGCGIVPGLAKLRSEQYESIVSRLQSALEKDDKRIEITY